MSQHPHAGSVQDVLGRYFNGSAPLSEAREVITGAFRAMCRDGLPPETALTTIKQALASSAASVGVDKEDERVKAVGSKLSTWLVGACFGSPSMEP